MKKRTVVLFAKWTVPVDGFGKAFRLGGQAVQLDFDAYYNAIRHAIRPIAGNETWLLQVKLTSQFPTSLVTAALLVITREELSCATIV